MFHCRDLYKTEIKSYQTWFVNAAVFWLQTFRDECTKRMEKALEIDKDVVQVKTGLVRDLNPGPLAP